ASGKSDTAPAESRFAPITTRRLGHRSANTPPAGPSTSSGRISATTVRPVSRAEPVMWKTYTGTATSSSQLPPLDRTWLAHSRPNERFLQMIILRIVLLSHGTDGPPDLGCRLISVE